MKIRYQTWFNKAIEEGILECRRLFGMIGYTIADYEDSREIVIHNIKSGMIISRKTMRRR